TKRVTRRDQSRTGSKRFECGGNQCEAVRDCFHCRTQDFAWKCLQSESENGATGRRVPACTSLARPEGQNSQAMSVGTKQLQLALYRGETFARQQRLL